MKRCGSCNWLMPQIGSVYYGKRCILDHIVSIEESVFGNVLDTPINVPDEEIKKAKQECNEFSISMGY